MEGRGRKSEGDTSVRKESERERHTHVHVCNTNFHRIEEGGPGGEHIAKEEERPVQFPLGTRVDAGHNLVL